MKLGILMLEETTEAVIEVVFETVVVIDLAVEVEVPLDPMKSSP